MAPYLPKKKEIKKQRIDGPSKFLVPELNFSWIHFIQPTEKDKIIDLKLRKDIDVRKFLLQTLLSFLKNSHRAICTCLDTRSVEEICWQFQ